LLAGRSPLPPVPVAQLDEFAARAAVLLDAPIGLVSLVDSEGQNLPGAFGLSEPWASERWTPLSHSFCQHVVLEGEPLDVANAHDEPLVANNPAVLDLGVIAYLGVPLQLSQPDHPVPGVVGALCAIDHKPRQWTSDQLATLEELAQECSAELADVVRHFDASAR
jgi:GAF domain-containing protein